MNEIGCVGAVGIVLVLSSIVVFVAVSILDGILVEIVGLPLGLFLMVSGTLALTWASLRG